jgi:hypothetical protein
MLNTQFTSFAAALDPTTGGYKIDVGGRASSLETIALQADTFAKSKVITQPIVSYYAVNEDGTYTFKFTALIPKDRITYISLLSNAASSGIFGCPHTGAYSLVQIVGFLVSVSDPVFLQVADFCSPIHAIIVHAHCPPEARKQLLHPSKALVQLVDNWSRVRGFLGEHSPR